MPLRVVVAAVAAPVLIDPHPTTASRGLAPTPGAREGGLPPWKP